MEHLQTKIAVIKLGVYQYQHLKLKELENDAVSPDDYKEKFDKIINKSCICVGLGTSVMLESDIDTKVEGLGVSVCPGPNIAYFSKMMSLKEMIDHIYGRANMIERIDRPSMFIKELNLYVDYLEILLEMSKASMTETQEKYLSAFVKNLNDGIRYYDGLFADVKGMFADIKSSISSDLDASKKALQLLKLDIEKLWVGENNAI